MSVQYGTSKHQQVEKGISPGNFNPLCMYVSVSAHSSRVNFNPDQQQEG